MSMHHPANPVLDVRRLSVAYGKVEAVSEVSLAVGEGQIVTVIGPNGAGKTTLLSAIMGLLESRGDLCLPASRNPRPRWKPWWRAACAWCQKNASCLPK